MAKTRNFYAVLREQGETVKELSGRSGLSPSVIYKAAIGGHISTPIARRLESVLDMSIEELDKVIKASKASKKRG